LPWKLKNVGLVFLTLRNRFGVEQLVGYLRRARENRNREMILPKRSLRFFHSGEIVFMQVAL